MQNFVHAHRSDLTLLFNLQLLKGAPSTTRPLCEAVKAGAAVKGISSVRRL